MSNTSDPKGTGNHRTVALFRLQGQVEALTRRVARLERAQPAAEGGTRTHPSPRPPASLLERLRALLTRDPEPPPGPSLTAIHAVHILDTLLTEIELALEQQATNPDDFPVTVGGMRKWAARLGAAVAALKKEHNQ